MDDLERFSTMEGERRSEALCQVLAGGDSRHPLVVPLGHPSHLCAGKPCAHLCEFVAVAESMRFLVSEEVNTVPSVTQPFKEGHNLGTAERVHGAVIGDVKDPCHLRGNLSPSLAVSAQA